MRSTKASAAVERLKRRSGSAQYSLSCRPGELFCLHLISANGQSEPVGTPLPMEEFVSFVNQLSPPKPKRESKLDAAFRTQLVRK